MNEQTLSKVTMTFEHGENNRKKEIESREIERIRK